MIQIQIDTKTALKNIEKQLGSLDKNKAPQILARAVNDTAKEARKLLENKAKETYAVKGSKFNKSLGIKKAKAANPVAHIKTEGRPLELYDFKTSPATYKTGDQKPAKSRARVKAHGGMKDLLLDGKWAFVTQFASGHKTMVQRTSKKRLPIKTLYSPSIPSMIGNEEEVYGIVEPKIQAMLEKHIQAQLNRVLGGR